jgi:transposase
MKYYIGCDAHKKYSVFTGISEAGEIIPAQRVGHERETYRSFLQSLPPASQIAIESTGNWYWLVDEMEKAGHEPALVNPAKAKLMMGQFNKTDKLDARGLAVLARIGTLPVVWIPPGELRDKRELPRMRMALVAMRTKLKNRIHATFAKYGITFEEVSDLFGRKGRQLLAEAMTQLPAETRLSVFTQLELLEQVERSIGQTEERIHEVIKEDRHMQLLKTIPGVGAVLAIVIALEIGDVNRFASGEKLASYAGKVPRVNSSGGKTFYGKVRPDINRYLKWAYTEAANVVVLQQKRMSCRHVGILYSRVRRYKGHAKAITAVGRHLAEATYWILKNNEPYQEPNLKKKTVSQPGVSATLA